MALPPVGRPSESKVSVPDLNRKSISTICREELQKLSEDQWPGSQEQMVAFVKGVLKDKGLVMSDSDISKLARVLRTSSIHCGVFSKN